VTGSEKQRHLLPEQESARIFRDLIVPELLGGAEPRRDPVVVLLGGQPGSGKSRLKAAVLRALEPRGGGVEIDGDNLRGYHPGYDDLLIADDRLAAYYTDLDAGRWLDRSMDVAAQRRVNVVIEGTMRRSEFVRAIAGRFRGLGYRSEAAIVATPAAMSRLGILQRYQRQRQALGYGRYTTIDVHDAGYRGLLDTADAMDRNQLIDAVAVYRRGGQLLYANRIDRPSGWAAPPGTRSAIETERSRPWTVGETAQFLREHGEVAHALVEDWSEEVDEVRALADQLLDPAGRIVGIEQSELDLPEVANVSPPDSDRPEQAEQPRRRLASRRSSERDLG
jgi:UDP-N-acetylglucosamine kinase